MHESPWRRMSCVKLGKRETFGLPIGIIFPIRESRDAVLWPVSAALQPLRPLEMEILRQLAEGCILSGCRSSKWSRLSLYTISIADLSNLTFPQSFPKASRIQRYSFNTIFVSSPEVLLLADAPSIWLRYHECLKSPAKVESIQKMKLK